MLAAGILVLVGAVGGGGYLMGYSRAATVAKEQSTGTAIQPNQAAKDIASGEGMSPAEMYNTLNELAVGEEFDMTYLTYMILMRNNESGMSRIAQTKATREELKRLATEQRDSNEALVPDWFKLQRELGFTH